MKKAKTDDIRSEYRREDLGTSVRGKYFKNYQAGTNLVLLNPDIAKVFPTDEDVNNALRSLIKVAQKTVGQTKGPSRRSKAHG